MTHGTCLQGRPTLRPPASLPLHLCAASAHQCVGSAFHTCPAPQLRQYLYFCTGEASRPSTLAAAKERARRLILFIYSGKQRLSTLAAALALSLEPSENIFDANACKPLSAPPVYLQIIHVYITMPLPLIAWTRATLESAFAAG
jgi:hypothetical protein